MTASRVSFSLPLSLPEVARLQVSVERCALVVMGVGPKEAPSLEVRGRHCSPQQIRLGTRRRRDSDVLSVDVDEDEGVIDELILRVPFDAEVWIESEVGPVSVRDLHGCYLSIESEVGPVELARVTGHLHVSTEFGPVRGDAVGGHLQIETEVGPISLQVNSLEMGNHHVQSEVGPISIELAAGMLVSVRAESEHGPVDVSYPAMQHAATRLHLESELGPVHVGVWQGAPAPPPPPQHAPEPGPSTAQAAPSQGQRDEVERILTMVQDGVLTATEANELLHTIEQG